MKRAVVLLAVVAAAWLTVDVLGDLTQSRPDEVDHDAATELVVDVDHDRFGTGDAGAAAALWAVCSAQTRSRATAPPAALGDGSFRVVLVPAVGEHEQRKLVGCLEDLTVDRVRGNVRSFEAVARSG